MTSPKSAWMCRLISAKTSWSGSASMRFGSTTRRDGSYACPLQYTLPHTVQTVSNVCINIADRPLAATLFRICIDQQLTVMGFILRFEHIFRDSIWTTKIRFKRSLFDLRFDLNLFAIRLKILKSRQVSYLVTIAKWNAWIIETLLLRMQFNGESALY